MSNWINDPVGTLVANLSPVPLTERTAMHHGPMNQSLHRGYFDRLACFRQIERGGLEPIQAKAQAPLRVVAWNVQRLRYVEAVGGQLIALAPDVVLLSEVDKGMARTGNGHPLAELSARIGASYYYGVEFLELGLGNRQERNNLAGKENLLGFHGNAILTSCRLERPFLIRLEADGGWCSPQGGEPRVGGRVAIGGQIHLSGRSVTLVSVHLESHSDPGYRRNQTQQLLDVLDRYDSLTPILIGGDFNTSTTSQTEQDWNLAAWREELRHDPLRRVRVEPYEPLFSLMKERGFDWVLPNLANVATERRSPPLDRPLGKVDWFFVRGLKAQNPRITAALGPDGRIISDHDPICVEIL